MVDVRIHSEVGPTNPQQHEPKTPIDGKPINFDIIKNSWNVYSLNDGTIYKSRFVLKEIWQKKDGKGRTQYGFTGNNEQVWLCNPDKRGPPDTKQYTTEEMKANLDLRMCSYTTVRYEPSEYSLPDDVRVKIFELIINLSRTSLFDSRGDRHYIATMPPRPPLFVVS